MYGTSNLAKTVFCAAIVCSVRPMPSWAWGREGHSIIARIAVAHLDPKVADIVDRMLSGQSMASVASWADSVRNSRPETYNWHFVDIPRDASGYDASRDCVDRDGKGDCVINALVREFSILRVGPLDPDHPTEDQLDALRYVIHFIGDLHQPFHCITDFGDSSQGDRGGNDVVVSLFGKQFQPVFGHQKPKPWNLHAAWDDGIIDTVRAQEDAYFQELLASLPHVESADLSEATLVQWAVESHGYAQVAYVLPHTDLGTAYCLSRAVDNPNGKGEASVIDLRLQQAGIRLANVLNILLGPTPANAGAAAPTPMALTATAGPSISLATPGAPRCDSSLWDHIYHGTFATARDRLKIINPCITIMGKLVHYRREGDGDYHIQVAVDASFRDLLNDKNNAPSPSGQDGFLVVEPICAHKVTQPDTLQEGVCDSFQQSIFKPSMIGRHVSITGVYVEDMDHGWRELHPVTNITVIQ